MYCAIKQVCLLLTLLIQQCSGDFPFSYTVNTYSLYILCVYVFVNMYVCMHSVEQFPFS